MSSKHASLRDIYSQNIIHQVWIVCSNNKVFCFPFKKETIVFVDNLTVCSDKACELSNLIEKNFGILCGYDSFESVYSFIADGITYKGYVLNLNYIGNLKEFMLEKTGGQFVSISGLEMILKNNVDYICREALLLLMYHLYERDRL